MFLGIEKQESESIALKDCLGQSLTYGELVSQAELIADKVKKRAVIFCLCENTVGSVAGYIGFITADAVSLVLSSKIETSLLNTLIETYSPAYMWVPGRIRQMFPYDQVFEAFDFVLLSTGNTVYPINDNVQFLMSTSGSTGSPKLVRYKYGNLSANARNVAKAFGWTKDERPVCDLGMQYTMGLNVINAHLYVGATVLLTTYNLMSSEFWDYIKAEKATNFTGVPFSYDILARLHFDKMDLPYLRTLSQGGGKLTDKRFVWLAEYARDNGKRFIASFGTTETSARISVLPSELSLKKTGSIGKAIPEGELFLIDSEGNILTSPEAEGELCYRGPNVTMGYASCRDDLLHGDDFNGEYHTGDLARRDSDGCYYITGRLSRFLKLLSYRISLDQCERLIQENFGIDCACAGNDNQMEIYITDESKKENVQFFISEKTGLFRNLFHVKIITEIPRNDTGKVKYKELV